MTRISERGLDLIKQFEGLRLAPYLCSGGYWTIGYGHNLGPGTAPRPDIEITPTEAESWLTRDIRTAEEAVVDLVSVPLTQGQFDALTSFVFNLGRARFEASTLRKKLNSGDYKSAAVELGRWVYASGRPQAGLKARRQAEVALFMEGTQPTEK